MRRVHLKLIPHPSMPPAGAPFEVWATVDHAALLGAIATTNIWFGISAPISRFAIPQSEDSGRSEELWQTTCFEAFLKPEGQDSYREWNFAPSGDWAAYDFSGYRENMAEAEIGAPPYVRIEDNLTWWGLGATIAVESDKSWNLGLSAVLEEKDGTKSYWALAHPDGEKPDFHSADCFAAKLA